MGGQPNTNTYAGYNRTSGNLAWAEVKEDFAQLINKKTQAIWKIKDVKILDKKDYPDIFSTEYEVDRACWGTYGKTGDKPYKLILLKDAETEHLEKILETQNHISLQTRKIINYILNSRKIQ